MCRTPRRPCVYYFYLLLIACILQDAAPPLMAPLMTPLVPQGAGGHRHSAHFLPPSLTTAHAAAQAAAAHGEMPWTAAQQQLVMRHLGSQQTVARQVLAQQTAAVQIAAPGRAAGRASQTVITREGPAVRSHTVVMLQ